MVFVSEFSNNILSDAIGSSRFEDNLKNDRTLSSKNKPSESKVISLRIN